MQRFILLGILLFTFFNNHAQDILTLNNDDTIVGDVKSFDKGVLIYGTSYSKSNFKIDWKSIKRLQTNDTYIIQVRNGKSISGTISIEDSLATITGNDSITVVVPTIEVVYLNSISKVFWDRMSLSIDGGYTHSKAANNDQLTLRGTASYLSTKINPDLYFNFVDNAIDANDSVRVRKRRHNYGGNVRVFLTNSWFGITGADFLKSDEMLMELRSTYTLGLGYYPIRNHKMYLNISTGAAINDERYQAEAMTDNTATTEGFVNAELNAFGLKDVSIVSSLNYFPSITDWGRNRLNFNVNVKFDLPKDFYIGMGYTLNYDSDPNIESISTSDYVVQTTVGWSL
ncbi:DUF481 domain-containing protein [Reichenbachiella agariperforans]|uniref:DUF481 domain-containing protein n=1 Tax=Reichenbachiella agariperforans TaxID=156994 RepID=UPI001C090F1E|nr:DUF481 domain-containing protein [Reichenbachiella agariperforans]MBU2916122.1 DUF481 domain-containing protein [Reichenbachiella agariperforans]